MKSTDYNTTPAGTQIIGTRETVPATAYVQELRPGPGGTLLFDYEGESKIHWDDQETQRDESGLVIFEDDAGNGWTWDPGLQSWVALDD